MFKLLTMISTNKIFALLLQLIVFCKAYKNLFYPQFAFDPYNSTINPYVFIPCYKIVCGLHVNCFQPFIINEYLFSLPPISACPEVYRQNLIRFLAYSRHEPELLRSSTAIKPQSRVAIMVHGILSDYNLFLPLILAKVLAENQFDYIVFIDWYPLANTYLVKHVPGTLLSEMQSHVNGLLIGRTVCNYVHALTKFKQINPTKMRIIGHSSGGNSLAQIGEFCQLKYNLKIGHLVGK